MNLCNNDLCASSLINTAGPPCKVALMVGFHRLNSPHKSSWRNVTSQWAITTHLHLQPKLLGEDCISLGHDFILANYLSSLNGCESVVTFKPAPCKKLCQHGFERFKRWKCHIHMYMSHGQSFRQLRKDCVSPGHDFIWVIKFEGRH